MDDFVVLRYFDDKALTFVLHFSCIFSCYFALLFDANGALVLLYCIDEFKNSCNSGIKDIIVIVVIF